MIDHNARKLAEEKVQKIVDGMTDGERLIAYQYLRNGYGCSLDNIGYQIEKCFALPKGQSTTRVVSILLLLFFGSCSGAPAKWVRDEAPWAEQHRAVEI